MPSGRVLALDCQVIYPDASLVVRAERRSAYILSTSVAQVLLYIYSSSAS